MNATRQLLRQLIRETIDSTFPLTENQLITLAGYVRANVRIPPDVINALRPVMKQYSGLTRVWTDVPVSVTDTELLKITRGRGYIACSLYPGAVMAYIHEEDWEYRLESGDLVFTEVDGVGFDPIQVLCDGLDAYPDSSKKEFISMAIDEHSYEEEIVIVSPTRITRTEQPEWEDDGIW